mgnify:CR=1 FL=1|jgi:hypothetical protein
MKIISQKMVENYIEVTYENGEVQKKLYLEHPDGDYIEMFPNNPETFDVRTPKDHYKYKV